jgi:hypothetical protein
LSTAQAEIVTQGTVIAVQATQGAAVATELAMVQAQQATAQQASSGLELDPNRQTVTIQTDLGGMLAANPSALNDARAALKRQLDRYPATCRAGFVLISGNAPDIDQGIRLAHRVDDLLRQGWPQIFTPSTGSEVFALPNEPPAGQVSIDIFFYSGCRPAG